MKTLKTLSGVAVALAAALPSFAHHEGTHIPASQGPDGPSALVIGAVVIGVAAIIVLAVKIIRDRT